MGQFAEVNLQEMAIQKNKGVESLILRRNGHCPVHRQVGEEGAHLRRPHVAGVAFAVEKDEPSDPIPIGFFGAEGKVAHPCQTAEGFFELTGTWRLSVERHNRVMCRRIAAYSSRKNRLARENGIRCNMEMPHLDRMNRPQMCGSISMLAA